MPRAVGRQGRLMRRILFAGAAVLAAMTFGGGSAHAYGDAPWCAITNGGFDVHYDCEYNSIEECRPHVIAGNRGFCNPNPYYTPAKRIPAPRHYRRRRR
ncbi:MAG: DUF3551 domain-containing protein [Pseudolabrys sp.]|jgi:hypothetical protein